MAFLQLQTHDNSMKTAQKIFNLDMMFDWLTAENYLKKLLTICTAHIAQNIAETCQKYFQSFKSFVKYCKIFHCNITILTFWNI